LTTTSFQASPSHHNHLPHHQQPLVTTATTKIANPRALPLFFPHHHCSHNITKLTTVT